VRPDLSYPDLRIAIEYDGDHHRTSRQWRSDRARRQLLEDAGWIVLEFTADDVLRRPEQTVERIRRAIAGRAAATGR
jgi:very-short-patch-repair endonuclease